jgi:hypothetical protein
MTAHEDSNKRRTGWIWVISIFYVISPLWGLFSIYLVLSRAYQITPAQAEYFRSFSSVDIIATLVIAFANIAGGITLFLLRRIAFYFFTGALALSILLSIWHAVAKGWVQALGTSGLAGAIIGYGISAAVCFYAWKLIKRDILI